MRITKTLHSRGVIGRQTRNFEYAMGDLIIPKGYFVSVLTLVAHRDENSNILPSRGTGKANIFGRPIFGTWAVRGGGGSIDLDDLFFVHSYFPCRVFRSQFERFPCTQRSAEITLRILELLFYRLRTICEESFGHWPWCHVFVHTKDSGLFVSFILFGLNSWKQ